MASPFGGRIQTTEVSTPGPSSRTLEDKSIHSSYNVYLRIKPLNVDNPSDALEDEHFSVRDASITVKETNKKNEILLNTYNFAKVFLPMASQCELFTHIVEPRLRDFFDNQDSLIFSYGTSSSGKSHTVQGTPANPGLIPRVLYSIFGSLSDKLESDCKMIPSKSSQAILLEPKDLALLEAEKRSMIESLASSCAPSDNATISETTAVDMMASLGDAPILSSRLEDDEVCSLWLSFYEVYNEQVFDLFTQRSGNEPKHLKVLLDNDDGSHYPANLKCLPARSWEEAYDLYRYGKRNLHVSSTLLNRKSSRSHSVFTIKMLSHPNNQHFCYYPLVVFSMCDLAGSERMMAHTESKTASSSAEMKKINNSLLVLSKCFLSLKRGCNTLPPFRDSLLTKLIKKFLVGQGKLSMITTISQAPELLGQTQQILKMASIAHMTKIVVNGSAASVQKVTPNQRFSTHYANRESDREWQLVTISESSPTDQDLEELRQKLSQLSVDKESLETANAALVEEKNTLLRVNTDLHKDYELMRERFNQQDEHISQLEKKLGFAEAKGDSWFQKTLQMDKEMAKVGTDFKEKLALRVELESIKHTLRTVMKKLKTHFHIDSNDVTNVTERAIYLYKDVKKAASEEIAELKEELEMCHQEMAEMIEKISMLEYEVALFKAINVSKKKFPTTALGNGTLSDMDEIEYHQLRSSARPQARRSCTSDEDDPVTTRKVKTSKKKHKSKKSAKNVPPSMSADLGPENPGRNRRKLLPLDIDHLPEDFVSTKSDSPIVQLSPRSAMKAFQSSQK